MKLNYRVNLKILGLLTLIEGLAMLPCGFAGLYFGESTGRVLLAFGSLYSLSGFSTFYHLKKYKPGLRIHEGYFIGCMTWVYCSLIGSLPFIFSGLGYSVIGSIFESVAGFTTTGCTVLGLESMTKSIIMWRTISTWLGGMGILVLVVSVFPALGIGGQSIAAIETTGPTLQKIGGRFTDTGKFLYVTYISFTLLEFICLLASGMGFFNSMINAFGSISTGGLFITEGSASFFATPYVKIVIIFFTLLSSMNYTLYYQIIKGKPEMWYKNAEIRAFLGIVLVASVLVSACLVISGTYTNVGTAVTDSFSQVVSLISTTGYYVCDYETWPAFAIMILTVLMFIGGCSMSTSGSLKVSRIMVLFKLIKRGIFKLIHPNATKAVVIQEKPISGAKVSEITTHILLFFMILFAGCILLSFEDMGLKDTITTTLGIFTNTGLSLSEGGVHGYFGGFSIFSQIVMCLLMIAGRLEMYSLILMFTGSFWSRNKANTL